MANGIHGPGGHRRGDRAARLGPEQAQVGVGPAEDGAGVAAQPAGEDRGVDAAVVDLDRRVAPAVEAVELGRRGVEAALDVVADHEQRRRRAVVGAVGGVGLGRRPNSENVMIVTRLAHVGDERGVEGGRSPASRSASRRCWQVRLVLVGVEAAERHVEDPDAQVGVDQPGDERELRGQRVVGEGRGEDRVAGRSARAIGAGARWRRAGRPTRPCRSARTRTR